MPKLLAAFLPLAFLAWVVLSHPAEERSSRRPSTAASDFPTISTGEVVQLSEHVRPGVWTVFEYTADW